VLIGLGSNLPHPRHGRPRAVLAAAIVALAGAGFSVVRASRIVETRPLGPSRRRYANAAVRAHHAGTPHEMLRALKAIEREFGRPPRARRWSARVLDCDLLAVGDTVLRSATLTLPHPALHQRRFVLDPMLAVAPAWRHPRNGLTVRHLHHRLTRARPVAPAPPDA
jgi:2-amino-4-hydroxy-6-hydroxymethyldihydropteridine diphosphokinase